MKRRNVRPKKCTFLTNVLNTFKNSNQSSIAAKRGGSFSTMTRHSCYCQPFLVPQYFNQAQSSLCILYLMCNTVHYSDDVTAAIVFCSIFQLFLVQNYFSIWSKGAKKVYQILNTVKYISVFSFENTHQSDFFLFSFRFLSSAIQLLSLLEQQ